MKFVKNINNLLGLILVIAAGIFVVYGLFSYLNVSAVTIANNIDASYVIGAGSGSQDFTNTSSGTTASTFNNAKAVYYDSADNRLFVSDSGNSRVLVFNTDSEGIPLDYTADNVLGQSDFTSSTATRTQSGMTEPYGLAYDTTNKYLFVKDDLGGAGNAGRILVYDVASIIDGENAIKVLGQENFTDNDVTYDQDTIIRGKGLDYDNANKRLFTNDGRTLIWDLSSGITDGMNASWVLGQPDFDTYDNLTTVSGVWAAISNDVSYDSSNDYLYVGDQGNRRILVYDIASITNGEDAINVIGQPDFTSNSDLGVTSKTFQGQV